MSFWLREEDARPERHVSARQRFRDLGFTKRAWTPELALRKAGVADEKDRAARLRGLQEAVQDGRLPDPAIEALIWAGYKELA